MAVVPRSEAQYEELVDFLDSTPPPDCVAVALLFRARRIQQPSREIAITTHRAPHVHRILSRFVKDDVPLERTKNNKESPSSQARMREAGAHAQPRLCSNKSASRLHRTQIAVSPLPGDTSGIVLRHRRGIPASCEDSQRCSDVNADGTVNGADTIIVRGRAGNSLGTSDVKQ